MQPPQARTRLVGRSTLPTDTQQGAPAIRNSVFDSGLLGKDPGKWLAQHTPTTTTPPPAVRSRPRHAVSPSGSILVRPALEQDDGDLPPPVQHSYALRTPTRSPRPLPPTPHAVDTPDDAGEDPCHTLPPSIDCVPISISSTRGPFSSSHPPNPVGDTNGRRKGRGEHQQAGRGAEDGDSSSDDEGGKRTNRSRDESDSGSEKSLPRQEDSHIPEVRTTSPPLGIRRRKQEEIPPMSPQDGSSESEGEGKKESKRPVPAVERESTTTDAYGRGRPTPLSILPPPRYVYYAGSGTNRDSVRSALMTLRPVDRAVPVEVIEENQGEEGEGEEETGEEKEEEEESAAATAKNGPLPPSRKETEKLAEEMNAMMADLDQQKADMGAARYLHREREIHDDIMGRLIRQLKTERDPVRAELLHNMWRRWKVVFREQIAPPVGKIMTKHEELRVAALHRSNEELKERLAYFEGERNTSRQAVKKAEKKMSELMRAEATARSQLMQVKEVLSMTQKARDIAMNEAKEAYHVKVTQERESKVSRKKMIEFEAQSRKQRDLLQGSIEREVEQRNRIRSLEEEVELLRRDINVVGEEKFEHQKLIMELEEERNKNSDVKLLLDSRTNETRRLRSTMDDIRRRYRQVQEALEEESTKRKAVEALLEVERNTVALKQKQLEQVDMEKKMLFNEMEALRSNVNRLEMLMDYATQKAARLAESVDERYKEINEMARVKSQQEKKIENLTETVHAQASRIHELQEEHSRSQKEQEEEAKGNEKRSLIHQKKISDLEGELQIVGTLRQTVEERNSELLREIEDLKRHENVRVEEYRLKFLDLESELAAQTHTKASELTRLTQLSVLAQQEWKLELGQLQTVLVMPLRSDLADVRETVSAALKRFSDEMEMTITEVTSLNADIALHIKRTMLEERYLLIDQHNAQIQKLELELGAKEQQFNELKYLIGREKVDHVLCVRGHVATQTEGGGDVREESAPKTSRPTTSKTARVLFSDHTSTVMSMATLNVKQIRNGRGDPFQRYYVEAEGLGRQQVRNLTWTLRQIRGIYDEKTTIDVAGNSIFYIPKPLTDFVVEWFGKKFGLRSLVDQSCIELVHACRAMRRENLEVDLFLRFLEGTYNLDQLSFYLYCRHRFQEMVPPLKKEGDWLTAKVVPVTPVLDLLSQVFVDMTPARQDETISNVCNASRKGTPSQKGSEPIIELERILALFVEEFRRELDRYEEKVTKMFKKVRTGTSATVGLQEFSAVLERTVAGITHETIQELYDGACAELGVRQLSVGSSATLASNFCRFNCPFPRYVCLGEKSVPSEPCRAEIAPFHPLLLDLERVRAMSRKGPEFHQRPTTPTVPPRTQTGE